MSQSKKSVDNEDLLTTRGMYEAVRKFDHAAPTQRKEIVDPRWLNDPLVAHFLIANRTPGNT